VLVAAIELFKALRLSRSRLERIFDGAGHMALRGRDISMIPCGYGGEDGRA
jgi:hypothetical protein